MSCEQETGKDKHPPSDQVGEGTGQKRKAGQPYTQIPNSLFVLMADMGLAELKVTLALARQTFGWHRTSVALTQETLEKLTGLSHQGLLNGLAKGIERRTIQREVVGRHQNGTPAYSYRLDLAAARQDAGEPPGDAPDSECLVADATVYEVDSDVLPAPAPVHEIDSGLMPPVHEVDREPLSPVHKVDSEPMLPVHKVDSDGLAGGPSTVYEVDTIKRKEKKMQRKRRRSRTPHLILQRASASSTARPAAAGGSTSEGEITQTLHLINRQMVAQGRTPYSGVEGLARRIAERGAGVEEMRSAWAVCRRYAERPYGAFLAWMQEGYLPGPEAESEEEARPMLEPGSGSHPGINASFARLLAGTDAARRVS